MRCTQGIYGEYSVASLGTGECGVYSLVSMTVREDVYAKCLQGTSSLHQPEHGVLVASLMDASKEGNVYRDGRNCLLSMLPEKLQLCQSEIYTTFCLNKENYRKNCVFSATAESGGSGDEKLRVVILVP